MNDNYEEINLEPLFNRLGESKFRSRFKLGKKERQYLEEKGWAEIERHAFDFVRQRLGPAEPGNDGKQTPMRNHPVFIAQHATGTCCRKCLEKWHRIEKGKELTEEQVNYIVAVLRYWLKRAMLPTIEQEN
ncbi:MAG: hypothetical protein BWY71_02000 [Planctomycetes bacterium ADurb.Bin412]|nr:MAG: hypothetical protein BWY71_02000 [Planctomycetes bacterium ADurb.Bin412]